ncbi:MAG: NAD(P)H-hydrate dehydratase [Alphaproteobacteria bacterium]
MKPKHTELLSIQDMYAADRATIASGISESRLMVRAAKAVVDTVIQYFPKQPVLILCGTGNNGGDGLIAARILREKDWDVTVSLLQESPELLKKTGWQDKTAPFEISLLDKKPLVIDALFGIGLSKPITGAAADMIAAINEKKLDVLAVDIPSGIHADTGEVMGIAPKAKMTVTFCRAKIGHYLYPAKTYRGKLVVADIGIDLEKSGIETTYHLNRMENWLTPYPLPTAQDHKYTRGTLLIWGGSDMTGAARLAARAARRIGTGLVVIACAPESWALYEAAEVGAIVKKVENVKDWAKLIAQHKVTACLIGPGAGRTEFVKKLVLETLKTETPLVLDADGFCVFEDKLSVTARSIQSPCLLTPHVGEFKRLFPLEDGKLLSSTHAAKQSNTTVLLKGTDTVIAHPDGWAVINDNAPAALATAGTGDVLAGMAAGLIAQGMATFDAASAAVWMHGAAAQKKGVGLIAEDLPDLLPAVMGEILKAQQHS